MQVCSAVQARRARAPPPVAPRVSVAWRSGERVRSAVRGCDLQPHLRKCFEAIDKLEFQSDLQMTKMMSGEGEVDSACA